MLSPVHVQAQETTTNKELGKQINNLQVKVMQSESKALDAVSVLARQVSRKVTLAKRDIVNGLKEDLYLDLPQASRGDIEIKREQLKNNIADWRSLLEYTELKEIRAGLADALVIAEADGLDIDKLTSIYERMKRFIRENDFRESEATVADRLKNLDLERADDDQRMRELIAKLRFLDQEIEATSMLQFWTRESLKADRIGVVMEILQHQLNIDYEDISQPMYLVIDGILSGLTQLGRLESIYSTQAEETLESNQLQDHSFDSDAALELAERYSLKLVTLGFEGEALAAEAAAKRQQFRLNLYKRATIAYIEALISGKDHVSPCNVKDKEPVTIEYEGNKIRALGCPDPVVKKLKAYQEIFRNFQSAEADRLVAEAEMLMAQQQVIADFMAAIPLVGEAIDIYSIYSGETLAGEQLSPLQRGLVGTMVLVPVVGPSAVKQAASRLDAEKLAKLELIKEFLGSVLFYGVRAADDLNTVRRDMIIYFAKQVDSKPELLKRLYHYLVDVPYYIDDATRARMKLWKTMRDAAEDKIEVFRLRNSPEFASIYNRASQKSNELFDRLLIQKFNGGSGSGAREFRLGKSNMPQPHVNALEQVSKERGQAIIVRPVGPDSADKLARNIAGAKPLSVKPKSSNWGPQRAFIPVDQRFSKLGNPQNEIKWAEITEYQKKSDACLAKNPPCANTVPLELPVNGEEMKVVIVGKDDSVAPAYRNSRGEILDPDTMAPFHREGIDATQVKPMLVFADANNKPLTADYDLLAVGTRRTEAGGPTGFDAATSRQVPREAGPKGTITGELDESVAEMNRALREKGGFTQGDLIHHGPEVFNPGSVKVMQESEIEDKLVLTVIDPDHGLLTIPHCDADCMRLWCTESGMCNPTQVCEGSKARNCIPVDGDRLLKDYMHNARLRGIDIYPHSSWKWGHHNGLSGWNVTSFLDDVPPKIFVESASSSSIIAEKSFSGYFGYFVRRMNKAARSSSDGITGN